MRTKSKYRREYRDGGRVDELPVDPPIEQAIEQPAEAVAEAPPAPPVDTQPEPQQPQPEPLNAAQQAADDATLALKRQIDALRQSEQAQRQPMPQPEMSREARLAAWKAEGLSDAEVQFFQRNPAMIDWPQLTGLAVHRALEAGLERGTPAHFNAVEKIFNANVHHAQAAAPAMQPTPKYFQPPPARSGPTSASFVSAPVSRSVPNGSGKRHSNGKVTLTPSEVEAARISGLTPEQYALQKIEYERQRETGEYRDNRDQR